MNWKIKREIIDLLKQERGYKLKKKGGDINILLIYPNSYNVGINNLGYLGIYEILNRHKGILCERAYIPFDWKKRKNFSLYSIESFRPSLEFDVWAFSISFELDFFNVVYILKKENITLFSKDRDDLYPLIIGGGIGLSANPEPLADIFDILLIGEGEELVLEFADFLILKKEKSIKKKDFFELVKSLEGVYIPSFTKIFYLGDKIEHIESTQSLPIKRRVYYNFPNDPMVSPIVSENAVFSNIALCELVRGCKYQCRFCLAGFFYRPYRISSIKNIYEKLKNFYSELPKLGLIVPAIDHSTGIKEIERSLEDGEFLLSLSSLRLEDINSDVLDLLVKSRQKTLTIAPETGSNRLRRVLNKGFENAHILRFVEMLKNYKIKTLKLYFMLGLPTESEEDVWEIYNLVNEIRKINKSIELSISISIFVPKPHTPFQWEEMKKEEYIIEKQRWLYRKIKEIKNTKIEMEDYFWSFWQGIFSRGDRRLNILWREIYESGEISSGFLKRILKKNKEFFENYLRARAKSEIFPWEVVDNRVSREYLWDERERAYKGELTGPCSKNCKICGVCL